MHFSFERRAVGWVSLETIVYSKAQDIIYIVFKFRKYTSAVWCTVFLPSHKTTRVTLIVMLCFHLFIALWKARRLRIVQRTDLRKFVLFWLEFNDKDKYFVLGMRRRLASFHLVLCLAYVILPAMTSSPQEYDETANSRSIRKNPTQKTGERWLSFSSKYFQ